MAVSPSLNLALAPLMNELTRLQARIQQIERNQRAAQLGFSSVENGSITFNDANGNPQLVSGLQPDGTFAHAAVTANPPPQPPDQPLAGPGVLSLWVYWDGLMANGTGPLADFAHIEVHCSAVPGFTPNLTTLQGTMTHSGLFGIGSLLAGTTYYVVFVAINAAGNASQPSLYASAVPSSVPASIAPGQITALQLQTGSITSAQIAAAAGILGSQIANNTITAGNIVAGTITAGLLAAGLVVAGIIDGTTINAVTLNGGTVTGSVIESASLSPGVKIDASGNIIVYNSHGAIVLEIAPASDALFVYLDTGSATQGALAVSLSGESGTDPVTSAAYQPGANAYVTSGGIRYAVGLNQTGPSAAPGLSVQSLANPPFTLAGFFALGSNAAALATMTSGQATNTDVSATVGLQSAVQSGQAGGVATITGGTINLQSPVTLVGGVLEATAQSSAPAPGAGKATFYGNVNGNPAAETSTGLAGQLPLVQTDPSTNTNANVVGAHGISAIWTIPANDMQAGTVYEIEVPWNATMEGQTLELGLSIDGSTTFTVNTTLSGTIVGSGIVVNGVIRIIVQVITTGTSGTINCFTDGSVNQASQPTLFSNSGGLAGNPALGVTLNTTVSHNIRVNSLWGASNAGQTVSGYGSKFTRSGP